MMLFSQFFSYHRSYNNLSANTRPFRLHFSTDGDEVTAAAGGGVADRNEVALAPGGIVGFSLAFSQIDC
jgi:hypothetical protein